MTKANTARKYSKTAAYPRTFTAICESIPDSVWEKTTGKMLAVIIDMLFDEHRKGGKKEWDECMELFDLNYQEAAING